MTILLLLLVVLLVWAIFSFNRLVRDRNRVGAGWSDIDVQLKRRHDLVPRLVEAVKGYASFERATLEAVIALRNSSAASVDIAAKGPLEGELAAGVRKLILLAEAYPELKANQNFGQLQDQLVEVEEQIQFARRYYNGCVRNLNTRIESFPDLLVARPFNFQPAAYFELEDRQTEQRTPEVSL